MHNMVKIDTIVIEIVSGASGVSNIPDQIGLTAKQSLTVKYGNVKEDSEVFMFGHDILILTVW